MRELNPLFLCYTSIGKMDVVCPIECVKSGCADPPDFISNHGAWLLTVIASCSAALGVCFTYFLKSRCKNIRTPCISCDRDVLNIDPDKIIVEQPTVKSS